MAAAWRLMNDPKYAFLPNLAPSALDSLRTNIIELVLGTDMKQHFGWVHIQAFFKTHTSCARPSCTHTHTRTANAIEAGSLV